jgi:hypothetical protein
VKAFCAEKRNKKTKDDGSGYKECSLSLASSGEREDFEYGKFGKPDRRAQKVKNMRGEKSKKKEKGDSPQ